MRKIIILLITVFLVTGCGNSLESVKLAVEKYNEELTTYNQNISEYNKVAKARNDSVKALSEELNSSQEAINRNEKPFDENTLVELKDAILKGNDVLVSEVEVLPEYSQLTVVDSMTEEELKTIKKQADQVIKAMKNISVPELPESVNYDEILSTLQKTHKAYEDSITGLKQITAPADDFVMARLQRIKTITGMEAVTEDHDPNGKMNKPGGYIGTVYFRDNRISDEDVVVWEEDTIIDIGTPGGGSIEIYPNVEDAVSRNEYLSTFDGSWLSAGSHEVYGSIIIRTSDKLTATQQKELTQEILNSLIEIEK